MHIPDCDVLTLQADWHTHHTVCADMGILCCQPLSSLSEGGLGMRLAWFGLFDHFLLTVLSEISLAMSK